MSESDWKKLEIQTTIINHNPHFAAVISRWCNNDFFSTSLKVMQALFRNNNPATSLYLHTCEKCSTLNPRAVSTQTHFVNIIYSYTDESDVFTPGCNMLTLRSCITPFWGFCESLTLSVIPVKNPPCLFIMWIIISLDLNHQQWLFHMWQVY